MKSLYSCFRGQYWLLNLILSRPQEYKRLTIPLHSSTQLLEHKHNTLVRYLHNKANQIGSQTKKAMAWCPHCQAFTNPDTEGNCGVCHGRY